MKKTMYILKNKWEKLKQKELSKFWKVMYYIMCTYSMVTIILLLVTQIYDVTKNSSLSLTILITFAIFFEIKLLPKSNALDLLLYIEIIFLILLITTEIFYYIIPPEYLITYKQKFN